MKSLFRIIALFILFCGVSAISGAEESHLPGDVFDAEIVISESSQETVAALFELDYDHSIFEITKQEQSGIIFSDDRGSMLDLNGLKPGDNLKFQIRISEDAPDGSYQINTKVREAVDLHEKIVPQFSFSPFTVVIAQKKAIELSVGDSFTFGRYEQDNDSDNGPEDIEWIVLDQQDGKALLLSQYGIEARAYNDSWVDTTWETCSLRSWLNSTFLDKAFDASEQSCILTTRVDNSKAQSYNRYHTSGGNDTQDQIFLLSYAEAWQYFSKDEDRICKPTKYAITQDAYNSADGYGWWWLRSPGASQDSATRVTDKGSRTSSSSSDSAGCIRPALWISLN